MTLRTRVVVGAALLLAGVLGLAALLSPNGPRHRITEEGYKAIKVGMSQEDVEKLLGLPAGDYTKHSIGFPLCGFGVPHETFGSLDSLKETLEWRSDDGEIHIGFDHDGRVLSK